MLGISYTLPQVAQIAGARDLFQGLPEQVPLRYVAFDTRHIGKGAETLFVALPSTRRDGHDFIPEAIDKGVRNFMTDRPLPWRDVNYAIFDHTLDALQRWAMAHRNLFTYPVIGITGSNGKTIVKEWLTTLLEMHMQVVKSPMSYNSRIGVPISLLRMHPQADVAIIEAGISQPGEMEVLAAMIRPTLGVLTHMGPAHAAGFESEQQKLREKLLLFEEVQELICGSSQTAIFEQLQQLQPVLSSAGTRPEDTLHVLDEQISEAGRVFSFEYQGLRARGSLPMKSEADRENALLALLAALRMGITLPEAASRLSLLTPVGMRTEMITDNPEITLINDAYNSDADSIRNALHLLAATENQPRKQLIITDVEHQGEQREEIQRELLAEAEALLGAGNVRTVGPVFAQIGGSRNYPSTDELLRDIRYEDFRDSTLLLKGARRFELERVIPLLNRKLNATFFQINLDALLHNFRTLQARLPEGVKTMCMVKAFSYGSGTWEIARELENAGADYLAVAYASEAIDLRNSGVGLPIMVMNPDSSSLDALIRYEVEPEISNMDILRRYLQAARMAGLASPRIHLKLETGMGRLGFLEEELGEAIAFLQQHPDVRVVSVMSHMAASDDPAEDAFTRQQVARFQAMYARLQSELGVYALRHVLNTPGVLRFPEYAFDMVRLGIGLYGIDPSRSDTGAGLTEMGSLHSSITQIHSYAAGTSIGYGRSQVAARETRIATLAIGYADGVPRNLGNGHFSFLVRGKRAPTFGRVCMDMLMLDVTDIPDARAGDEVVVFGRQGEAFISVSEFAAAAGTIAYEILVRISPRVRRLYVRE